MKNDVCDPQAIKDQASRTEGQVVGIARMIEAERSYTEILQQVMAARASLQRLGIMMLEAEAKGCLGKQTSPGKLKELEQVIYQLFRIT